MKTAALADKLWPWRVIARLQAQLDAVNKRYVELLNAKAIPIKADSAVPPGTAYMLVAPSDWTRIGQ